MFELLDLRFQISQREEAHIAVAGRLLLHHLSRDLQEKKLDSFFSGALDHQVASPAFPVPGEYVQFALLQHCAFVHGGLDRGCRQRHIHGSNVHQCLTLLPVDVRTARHRVGVVELHYECNVRVVVSLSEGNSLPVSALILAQAEHLKGTALLDPEQALPGCVNAPPPQVAADPTAIELLSNRKHGAGTAEKVSYQIALT